MRLALASVLALSGCLSGESGDDPVAPQIIGGVTDSADPAVGFFRTVNAFGPNGTPSSISGCTATLISPRMLVTAAHCATGGIQDVTFDAQPDIFGAIGRNGYIPATSVADSAYDGVSADGHDVALVFLAGYVPTAAKTRGATPGIGATVRAAGYGMDTFGDDGAGVGTRRTVLLPVLDVEPSEIVAGVDGVGTCHGDSGGPLFDGNDQIVGVVSYGDTVDCHGSSHFMRLDDSLDFIHLYAPNF